MAVRAMSRATGDAARANPRHTQLREGHRRPAADGRAPLGPAPSAMGGLARLQLGGQRGTTRTSRLNRGDRGTGDTTARAAASPDNRPSSEWLTGSHPDAPWPCGQCPERRGSPRARTPAPPNRERDTGDSPPTAGHRWGPPWCNGRVSAAPTRLAAGHDAHGPAKQGGPGDGRHRRESGSVARHPAKFRVAHRQPPGRAMAVRAMSRATGVAARANPRPTQPREGHRRLTADGRAPLGPPLVQWAG
ncbi:hypothetical protein IHE45_14G051600 [Dioscorea alata]|uniref:Uncharacterized protein n=2 Tax=Dioscorea alata TaxID=55571 RepID=A0ACB7URX8_DIOAL|nr:hypothetical protein IHE45_14G051500 [Dioscorea alata]KAH7663395.1 hypothetical protein IHE45_14G051600 [Dioscorea alata]